MRSILRSLLRSAFACVAGVALVAAGHAAESTSSTSSTSRAPAPAGAGLASLKPEDEFETYLLAHPKDAAGLAEQATKLSKLATAAPPEEARRLRLRARVFAAAAIEAGSGNLFM